MTLEKLGQYRALKKEIEMLDKRLNKLYDRETDIPVVAGKVTGSSSDFPYTEVRTTVQMDDPVKSEALRKVIKAKKNRLNQASAAVVEIEEFISTIPNSLTRQIFEMRFIDGKSQLEIGQVVNLDRSRISRRIDDYIKRTQRTEKV